MSNATPFYAAVAQIIPILMVVLVIEMRLMHAWPWVSSITKIGVSAILLAVFLGEFRALRVLQTGDESRFDSPLVWFALLCLASLVVGMAFSLGRVSYEREQERRLGIDPERWESSERR